MLALRGRGWTVRAIAEALEAFPALVQRRFDAGLQAATASWPSPGSSAWSSSEQPRDPIRLTIDADDDRHVRVR